MVSLPGFKSYLLPHNSPFVHGAMGKNSMPQAETGKISAPLAEDAVCFSMGLAPDSRRWGDSEPIGVDGTMLDMDRGRWP